MDNNTILLVDDEENVLKSIQRSLRGEKYEILTAANGEEALDVIKGNDVAVIVTDERMIGMDGVEVLQNVREWSPDTFRMMLTGHGNLKLATAAINRGELHRFVAKPWNDLELSFLIRDGVKRYNLMAENQRLNIVTMKQRDELKSINATLEGKVRQRTKELEEKQADLKKSYLEAIESLAFAVDEKDPYTHHHSRRVTELSVLISKDMGLSFQKQERIKVAGLLHDIGKIGIKDEVLLKSGKLSREEFEEIKTHPLRGAKILKPIREMKDIIPIIRHHHERFDGKGYNSGLKGLEIPLEARIMMVADAYDAMTSDRSYRNSLGHNIAVERIKKDSGSQFDPTVVKSFLRLAENLKDSATDS